LARVQRCGDYVVAVLQEACDQAAADSA
jgi:hypothetical protein